MATIGERIKLERERRGWTQAKLADMLNIKIGTLSGYERNYRQPDLTMLEKIAAAFGVSTDYLLGRTDDPRPANKIDYETQAAHRSDDPMADLPPEAIKSLEEFKEFILRKYGKHKE